MRALRVIKPTLMASAVLSIFRWRTRDSFLNMAAGLIRLFCCLLLSAWAKGRWGCCTLGQAVSLPQQRLFLLNPWSVASQALKFTAYSVAAYRSEEHTSELQSRPHLVCRLL